ncbi:MAG: asparagine synthase (glutamine-hydrolyzing) [Cytophagales bacterium]
MCGIAGVFSGERNVVRFSDACEESVIALKHRGPDVQQSKLIDEQCLLGHTRLSIIDTSGAANQPFYSSCGRFVLVFNGEIYNFKTLKTSFLSDFAFKTQSDTEVLIELFGLMGEKVLDVLVGFFAFAIYDIQEKNLFLARDRFGKKPLWYHFDGENFFFSSELNSLLKFPIERKLNKRSMGKYFLLDYIPGEESILENVFKLQPGCCLEVFKKEGNAIKIKKNKWYSLNYSKNNLSKINEKDAQEEFRRLMNLAVEDRLVSDVPLGSFLSGGIDSSIVSGIASSKKDSLHTYSIGFPDQPFFDESRFATLCAKKFGTIHKVFGLRTNDLFEKLPEYLDSIHEPFANSSALLLYILCEKAKNEVTVALTGDGADEVFGGYNKQRAILRANQPGILENLIISLGFLWKKLPKSRSSKFTNLFRQFEKFAESAKLSRVERYKRLCQMSDYLYLSELINEDYLLPEEEYFYNDLIDFDLNDESMNQELKADVELVLSQNMLHKLDSASMAKSIELRSPFMDHRLIEFAFTLPSEFKINKSVGKKIVRESFKDLLPVEVFNRPKKGFDVPLAVWFSNELKGFTHENSNSKYVLTCTDYLRPEKVKKLQQQVLSKNKGDSASLLWAVLVFNEKLKSLRL